MTLANRISKLTIEEYLEGEKSSTIRHEYLDGEVYAMSGASRNHNFISGNFYRKLQEHLRGGPCQTFIADVKVRIEALNIFYYPDVVVACEAEDNDQYFITQPRLIVEVASPSTASTDRREKQRAYRKLQSLQEYVVIEQEEMKAEIYRRDQRGYWWVEELNGSDDLNLESVDLTFKLADLYDSTLSISS